LSGETSSPPRFQNYFISVETYAERNFREFNKIKSLVAFWILDMAMFRRVSALWFFVLLLVSGNVDVSNTVPPSRNRFSTRADLEGVKYSARRT